MGLVRQRIEQGGERLWRFEDFRGLTFSAVAQALSRLTRQGAIERLSKGVYYRNRETTLGKSRPNPASIRNLALRRNTMFTSGIAAAMFITAIAGASPIIAAAAIVLWGLSFGAFPVNVQAFLTQAAGDEAESGGALMLTAFQIAISAGAIVGGLVVDSIGPLGVFAFAGVMTVAGTILISAVRGVRLQKA